jgi:2C-methyl-D-erythritol 2,4-cyclodiphosphate synthase
MINLNMSTATMNRREQEKQEARHKMLHIEQTKVNQYTHTTTLNLTNTGRENNQSTVAASYSWTFFWQSVRQHMNKRERTSLT